MRESAAVSRRLKVALAAAAALTVALVAAPSALAIGLQNLSAAPTDLTAGANSDVNIHVEFTSPGDDVKDLVIGLPPGVVGDPNVTPFCSEEDLNANACTADEIVGTVQTDLNILALLPLTVNGNLYNLKPHPGEPARFGIVLNALPVSLPGDLILPPIILQSGVALRQTDFGLDTVINDIPNTATVLQLDPLPPLEVPIDITSMDVSLAGEVAGRPFLRNPTSCVPATARFTASSWTGSTADPNPPATGQAPSFTPQNCDALPFTPEFTARAGAPGLTALGTRPPLTTVISQTSEEAGLRRARVVLPPELGTAEGGLGHPCPVPDFEAGTCPASAIVGSAVASSPLVTEPLTGPVALVETPGLPEVRLDLRGPLNMQLTGHFVTEGGTGVEFDGLPDIPIADFALTFNGGPSGLLVTTRNLCIPPPLVFTTTFESHAGGPLVSGQKNPTIEGCGPIVAPKVKGKLRGARGGNPRLKVVAKAGSSPIRSVKVKLPEQLDFATGAEFGRGTKIVAGKGRGPVRHTRRKIRISVAGDGANRVLLKAARGAIESLGRIGGKAKLRLRVTVVDIDGTRTARKVKLRTKR